MRTVPYLTLVHANDLREAVGNPRPLPSRAPVQEPADRVTSIAAHIAAALTGEDELLDRLEAIGSLAPTAPLSFLAVEVDGVDTSSDQGAELISLVAYHVRRSLRPVDVVGRLGASGFGVILQGTSDRRAASTAARLQHILNRIAAPHRGVAIIVSAATGRGLNAPVLPEAAVASLPATS